MMIDRCIAARLPALPAVASTSRSLTRVISPNVCTDSLAPTACTESWEVVKVRVCAHAFTAPRRPHSRKA